MVQYGQGEIVFRAARTRSSDRYIHRDPDNCPLVVTSGIDPGDMLEKPLPSFNEDTPRCPGCFFEGDTTEGDD